MNARAILVSLSVVLAPTAALAESWTVTEGAGGKVKGSWNVTVAGGTINGSATMTGANGRPLTYGVSGAMKDGSYTLHRVNPSDGVACIYVGRPQGSGASGSSICNGQNAPWIVVRPK